MLSVLIPSYDNSVVPLFTELRKQLKAAKVPFEIIAIDNASKSPRCKTNQSLNEIAHCQYIENKTDVGRSAIRNQLAALAKHDWLLFLDDDVMPTTAHFISSYIREIEAQTLVCCGGLQYEPDSEHKEALRYQYGIRYEEVPVGIRNSNPYKYFLASNVLIQKQLFEKIQFNESITRYGYEDLLFAKDLREGNVKLKHIDNPVYHLGIDANEVFIQKSEQAIKNMVALFQKGILRKEDTGIFKTYAHFKSLGMLPVLQYFSATCRRKAAKGSVLFFNLYRLTVLARLLEKTQ